MVPTGHKSPGCFLLSSDGLFYQNLDGAQEEICAQRRMCGMSVGHRLSRNDQPMPRVLEEEGPSCFPEYKGRRVAHMLKSSTCSHVGEVCVGVGVGERTLRSWMLVQDGIPSHPPISCISLHAPPEALRFLFIMCNYLFLYSHPSRVEPKELAGLTPTFVFTPSSPPDRYSQDYNL